MGMLYFYLLIGRGMIGSLLKGDVRDVSGSFVWIYGLWAVEMRFDATDLT